MSGAANQVTAGFVPPPAGEFLGHPKALWNLFGSEFWERFMFYGMRAMLAVHVAAAFFAQLGAGADAEASKTYGGYTAMVYMTGILGGYVADRILGYPLERRKTAWKRLENELDRPKLAAMTTEIGLSDVPKAAAAILNGEVRGRIVVKIG